MSRCRESAASESLAGTCPTRNVWFIIEQPGAWGADALVESDLPSGFGARLKATITDPAIGIALARRPNQPSVERRTSPRRRLWLAHTSPGGVRMRSGSMDDITDVLKWNWEEIARGVLPPFGRRSADPALFICTNGKKDMCCAEAGRELVSAFKGDLELTGQIFESSHLTGHRFAPTALLLPWGLLYGRLSESTTREILAQSWDGKSPVANLRGRTALPEFAQVAEIAVRQCADITAIDVLDVVVEREGRIVPSHMAQSGVSGLTAEVRHIDGRAWKVAMEQAAAAPRQISCGTELQVAHSWLVTSLSPTITWC